MTNDKIDWSQYEVKDEEPSGIDWSEYEVEEEPMERTGLLGIGADLARGLGNAYKGGIKFAADTPEMLEDLGEQLLENPGTGQLRGVAQIGAEAADIGKGIINAPYNLNQYLARKHLLPQVLGKLGKFIPHIPEDTGVEKALGLEPKKGDKLIRGLTEGAAIASGGVPIAKGIKKAVTAPSKERLFKRALEDKLALAQKEQVLSESEVKALEDALKLKYSELHGERIGEVSPIGQQVNINVKKHELAQKKPLTEIPEKEIGELPEAPDIKAIMEEHKSNVEAARKSAEEKLGILENPRLKAGAKFKTAIKDLHQSASDLYKAARDTYKSKQITANNSAEIKSATKELEALKEADELAPGYGSGTAEQKALEANIEALKGEKVNASDIFDLQRTLEKMAETTRKKQYSGVTELEFKRLGGIADRLDSHADKLAKRLEEVGGKDVQKIITEANKGWRTYKDLTKKNPLGKAAMKGDVPSNAMIELAKDHPGNEFLNGLVESNPELKKHILAAYAGESNVNKLLKPASLTKKYLESLPEVDEHVNALKQAINDYRAGEVNTGKVKREYDELVQSMKRTASEQKIRQDAINESKELEKQIKFHEEAIPKLEEKIKIAKKKGAEVKRLEEQKAQHQRDLADKGTRLKKAKNTILKIAGILAIGNKLGL